MNIAVFGCGYVGLVTAACFAKMGHRVVGYDIDREKIAALRDGRCPIYEPGLPDLLAVGMNEQRIEFTTLIADALAEAEIAFICVGTPQRGPKDGRSDLSYVAATAEAIAVHAPRDLVVVGKSTVPVGTGREIRRILERRKRAGVQFHIGSNPETLKEGTAVEDFLHPDRIIIGADDEVARKALLALYESFGCEKVVVDVTSAELVKLVANTMLAQRISTANIVARLCEASGADVESVMRGVGLDARIGPAFLRAGIGFGGSCFPKDVHSLAAILEREGIPPALITSIIEANDGQGEWFVRKIERVLWTLRDRRIALLGLAFKPDTDDLRESRAMAIAERLMAEGAHVVAFDPVAMRQAKERLPGIEFECATSAIEACRGAQAIVLATEWKEFHDLDWRKIADLVEGKIVFDGRNFLDPDAVRAAGFEYHGVGRPR